MSIESQLERICVALEALATIHAGPAFKPPVEAKVFSTKTPDLPKDAKLKVTPVNAEPAKADSKPTPEATNAEQGGASLGDLQEKVKALAAKAGRDAVIEVFKGFKIDRMSELDAAQYVAMDLALAKAITKANEE